MMKLNQEVFQLKNLPALLIFIFGTLFSLVSEVASYLISDIIWLSCIPPLFVKIGLCIVVVFVAVLYFFIARYIRPFITKPFGFSNIQRMWFPKERSKREKHARQIFDSLILADQSIKLASISGEWDIIKPFSDTELKDTIFNKVAELKILLAHPSGRGIEYHCKNETDQDIDRMKQKIKTNTNKLLELGSSKCKVRWYNDNPVFHLIANNQELHFGYFPKGQRGHKSRRYIVKSSDPLFQTMNTWFDNLWDQSKEASEELKKDGSS